MKYFVIKEKFINEDGMEYSAFGIEVREKDLVLQRFSDISLSYIKIRKLCKCCNRFNLDIVHFEDVINDFVVESII